MRKLTSLALALCFAIATGAIQNPTVKDDLEDLKPEESRRRIYDIIQSHENRKYGDHGGHEYEEGEQPLKSASRKRYGYLPAPKAPVYYEVAPRENYLAKDNVYRENVAAYAPKDAPVHLANSHHRVIASPVSHSHYAVVDPNTHDQYVIYEDPKSHHKRPLVLDHKPASYVIHENPHYAAEQEVVVKQPVVYVPQHHPHPVVKQQDYDHYDKHHHALDKSHHSSGHGYHGDNSVHGESGHKAHKHYEVAGHKEHSSKGGHLDEHDRHHNKAHYERDRGYHYEKAYAYDRIRAHHDIGHDKGVHSGYHAHHGSEGHKKSGDHGGHSYVYFKKDDRHGGHGHHDSGHLNHHHAGGQGYDLKYNHPYGK